MSPKHARGCARRVNKSNRAVRRPVAGNLHRAMDVLPGGRAPGRPQRRIRPGSARSTGDPDVVLGPPERFDAGGALRRSNPERLARTKLAALGFRPPRRPIHRDGTADAQQAAHRQARAARSTNREIAQVQFLAEKSVERPTSDGRSASRASRRAGCSRTACVRDKLTRRRSPRLGMP
jgi:hypothetical protein